MFFKESRTGFNQQTNKRILSKPETISGVCLGIITLDQGACKRSHSMYHSNRLTLSGGQVRHLDVLLESRKNDCWNVDGCLGTIGAVGQFHPVD